MKVNQKMKRYELEKIKRQLRLEYSLIIFTSFVTALIVTATKALL
jgi:hypothetical protein